jgi:hypothetical protein
MTSRALFQSPIQPLFRWSIWRPARLASHNLLVPRHLLTLVRYMRTQVCQPFQCGEALVCPAFFGCIDDLLPLIQVLVGDHEASEPTCRVSRPPVVVIFRGLSGFPGPCRWPLALPLLLPAAESRSPSSAAPAGTPARPADRSRRSPWPSRRT